MAGSIRIELNGAGIRSLLGSGDVRSMLEGKGSAVKSAAESRAPLVSDGSGGEIKLPIKMSSGGVKRARVTITSAHPAGTAVEAKYRLLVSSLDAAK